MPKKKKGLSKLAEPQQYWKMQSSSEPPPITQSLLPSAATPCAFLGDGGVPDAGMERSVQLALAGSNMCRSFRLPASSKQRQTHMLISGIMLYTKRSAMEIWSILCKHRRWCVIKTYPCNECQHPVTPLCQISSCGSYLIHLLGFKFELGGQEAVAFLPHPSRIACDNRLLKRGTQ